MELKIQIVREENDYTVLAEPSAGSSKVGRLPLFDAAELQQLTLLINDNLSQQLNRDLGAAPSGAVVEGQGACVKEVKEFGERLYRKLFDKDKPVGKLFRELRGQHADLRVRLVLDQGLMNIPWELLHDQIGFLAEDQRTLLVRAVGDPVPLAQHVAVPLRLLLVIASPDSHTKLDTDGEERRIREALAPLVKNSQIEVEAIKGPDTFGQLSRARKQMTKQGRGYNLFHFICHGQFSERDGESYLLFEDPQGGPNMVPGGTLANELYGKYPPQIVVLNACELARDSAEDPMSGIAVKLAAKPIPAVVAMQRVISDDAAKLFAREFYSGVADLEPVDQAMATARRVVHSTWGESVEWSTPVLYLSHIDGQVISLPSPAEQMDRARELAGKKSWRAAQQVVRGLRKQGAGGSELAQIQQQIEAGWIEDLDALLDQGTTREQLEPCAVAAQDVLDAIPAEDESAGRLRQHAEAVLRLLQAQRHHEAGEFEQAQAILTDLAGVGCAAYDRLAQAVAGELQAQKLEQRRKSGRLARLREEAEQRETYQGELDAALQLWEDVLELDQTDAQACENLTRLRPLVEKQRRIDRALEPVRQLTVAAVCDPDPIWDGGWPYAGEGLDPTAPMERVAGHGHLSEIGSRLIVDALLYPVRDPARARRVYEELRNQGTVPDLERIAAQLGPDAPLFFLLAGDPAQAGKLWWQAVCLDPRPRRQWHQAALFYLFAALRAGCGEAARTLWERGLGLWAALLGAAEYWREFAARRSSVYGQAVSAHHAVGLVPGIAARISAELVRACQRGAHRSCNRLPLEWDLERQALQLYAQLGGLPIGRGGEQRLVCGPLLARQLGVHNDVHAQLESFRSDPAHDEADPRAVLAALKARVASGAIARLAPAELERLRAFFSPLGLATLLQHRGQLDRARALLEELEQVGQDTDPELGLTARIQLDLAQAGRAIESQPMDLARAVDHWRRALKTARDQEGRRQVRDQIAGSACSAVRKTLLAEEQRTPEALESALELLDETERLTGGRPELVAASVALLMTLGLALKDDRDKAWRCVEQAFELDPESDGPRTALAFLCCRFGRELHAEGRTDQAREAVRRGIRLVQDRPDWQEDAEFREAMSDLRVCQESLERGAIEQVQDWLLRRGEDA